MQDPLVVKVGNKDHTLEAAEDSVRKSGGWFYWIAGLSLANTAAIQTGLGYGMIIGLGVTQIVDAVAYEIISGDPSVRTVALASSVLFSVLVSGMFVFFGVFARKAQLWAFVSGIVLYALDSLVFLVSRDWLALGFHVFVLVSLFGGITWSRAIRKARQAAIHSGDANIPIEP